MAGGSEGAGAGAGAACGTAGPLGSRASPAGLLVLLMLSIGDGRVGICAVKQSHMFNHVKHWSNMLGTKSKLYHDLPPRRES